jgi:hypothetical protein
MQPVFSMSPVMKNRFNLPISNVPMFQFQVLLVGPCSGISLHRDRVPTSSHMLQLQLTARARSSPLLISSAQLF